ncbi:MAG TPA: FAD-binding protein [Magnetospirillaceae bacterium]|jgi:xylitol oxidase
MTNADTRTNWAKNLVYGADRFVVPTSVAEAQEAVRAAKMVRVVGSRHCFNDIADTTGTQISLERLNRVVALDKTKSQVTIEGGVRYGELGPYLHDQGYALLNMASLPHISVAGAIATATHGSGALGNLATAITAIEFVKGDGDLVTLSRDKSPDVFPGAVVHLGTLGVVTKLTLAIRSAFQVRQDVFLDLPFDAYENHFDAIMASGYSVSAFTPWQIDVVEQVWVKSEVEPGTAFAAKDSLFGGRPSTVKMHPIVGVDSVNCTEQLGVAGPAHDRLPHFRMGFTPASGDELQVEYFVPRDHAVAAIRALRQFGPRMKNELLVGEIRTVAADDLWMSPCYQVPCVVFHFSFKQDWPALKVVLPRLEAALAPYHPRPHWGKMFTMPPATIRRLFPRLTDFRALMDAHDPAGKFRNAYMTRTLLS